MITHLLYFILIFYLSLTHLVSLPRCPSSSVHCRFIFILKMNTTDFLKKKISKLKKENLSSEQVIDRHLRLCEERNLEIDFLENLQKNPIAVGDKVRFHDTNDRHFSHACDFPNVGEVIHLSEQFLTIEMANGSRHFRKPHKVVKVHVDTTQAVEEDGDHVMEQSSVHDDDDGEDDDEGDPHHRIGMVIAVVRREANNDDDAVDDSDEEDNNDDDDDDYDNTQSRYASYAFVGDDLFN